MNIEVVDIKNRGERKSERLVLKALTDLDVGYYIVFQTTKTGEDTFSSSPERVFWFPDNEVQEGDLVVLYSKEGKNSTRKNKSGNSTHFFYWNQESPIYKDEKKIAVVIEAKGWT